MAIPSLQATDIFSPELLATSPSTTHAEPLAFHHPDAGEVQVRATNFPHLQVMAMDWKPAKDFTLFDPTPCAGISINFVLEGGIHSRFKGIKHELLMGPQSHNLIHTPESGHTNQLRGNQALSMLLINLDKDFFGSSLGQGDAWSDQVLSALAGERPFSGGQGVPTITPQMRCLIGDIWGSKAAGPMRNLLIQSRVLELVALQIDQFRVPVGAWVNLPVQEVDQLNQLKAHLDLHFLEEHSLAGLSRFCGLNEFKVKKGFRHLFGTSVFHYLRTLRMDYAGQLLRNSALSVDEVADRLSYEHANHFSLAFRNFTGLTPSQYRQGKSARA
ncbi:AraC family transcriptional regulator [Spirosoma knui]